MRCSKCKAKLRTRWGYCHRCGQRNHLWEDRLFVPVILTIFSPVLIPLFLFGLVTSPIETSKELAYYARSLWV